MQTQSLSSDHFFFDVIENDRLRYENASAFGTYQIICRRSTLVIYVLKGNRLDAISRSSSWEQS